MFYQIPFSPQVKRCASITYKHGIYELPHELPNDLRLRILRRVQTMKFFFHRWLNFSFDSFLSTFSTRTQLRNVNEIFQSIIMIVFQKKKFLPDF